MAGSKDKTEEKATKVKENDEENKTSSGFGNLQRAIDERKKNPFGFFLQSDKGKPEKDAVDVEAEAAFKGLVDRLILNNRMQDKDKEKIDGLYSYLEE